MNPSKKKELNRIFYLKNKDKIKAKSVLYYKNNKEKILKRLTLREYGVSPEEYDEMVKKQGNRCCICQKEDSRALSVDHDHKTGKVRALLCSKCNLYVGHIENTELLEKALQYIAKYK